MKNILCAALALLFCMALPTAAAASDFGSRTAGMAEITGVRVSVQPEKVRIVVDADREVSCKTMALSDPSRIVVDIPHAWLSPDVKKEISISSRFATKLRAAQFDKDTVRIVVETTMGRNNYSVFPLTGGSVPGRVVMDFGDLGPDTAGATIRLPDAGTAGAKEKEKEKPQAAAADSPRTGKDAAKDTPKDAPKREEPTEEPAADSREDDSTDLDREIAEITGLKGKVITLDPGHGGSDSGAIGPSGVTEKSVALRVARELQRLLVAEGATVYMTRTMDTEVSEKGSKASDIEELQARCDIANQNGSDIFISLHMDSFTNNAAKGTTAYYYAMGSKKSRLLADKIRTNLVDQLGTQSRGTQSCNFYVVKHTDMPAVLVEIAFISNKAEERLMASMKGVKKAAQGIADGIADYFG